MFKTLWLTLALSFAASASTNDIQIIKHQILSSQAGVELLRHHLEESRYLNRSQTFSFEAVDEKTNYQNGDFVILWGVGSSATDLTITENEYKGLWRVMNYLSQKEFRVILNVRSTAEDLSQAIVSATTSVVVFSSHGNESAFYDFNHNPIPQNILSNHSTSMYQFILSACNGTIALRKNYVMPADLTIYSWAGLTNSTELLEFLVSDNWTGLEGKPASH